MMIRNVLYRWYKEIKHMTSYINIISDSSEKLFDGSEEYIDLPPEMKELEVKLNHFRSESIKNKYEDQKYSDSMYYFMHGNYCSLLHRS